MVPKIVFQRKFHYQYLYSSICLQSLSLFHFFLSITKKPVSRHLPKENFYPSVFSASQIVGGLLLGALTDAKFLRKKTVLFISFGGSAIAYLMIAYGGFTALILSRILVGLIKQTMTISYSLLTACTAPETRSRNVGRIQSSSTAAWILGPSTGALLFKCIR